MGIANHLISATFKIERHLRKELSARKTEIAATLQTEFGDETDTEGYPDFAAHFAKSVLVYQGGPGATQYVNNDFTRENSSIPPDILPQQSSPHAITTLYSPTHNTPLHI